MDTDDDWTELDWYLLTDTVTGNLGVDGTTLT
jgi:hypothetical protein